MTAAPGTAATGTAAAAESGGLSPDELARAEEHLAGLYGLSMDADTDVHPLERLYVGPDETLQAFLDSHPLTAACQPKVEGFEDGRRVIATRQPAPAALDALAAEHGQRAGMVTWVFQKLYMDRWGNTPRNLTIKGEYGQTYLSFNNVGAAGPHVAPGAHVNLFVGASESFSSAQQLISDTVRLTDWIAEIEPPFSEAAINLNGAKEGTHYPHIIRRATYLAERTRAAGGVIDNLFSYGGWHNLIYNEHEPEDWRGYCETLEKLAPRTCFFGIASPVCRLSYAEIEDFCARGHIFWGNVEQTEANYERLRAKIFEYDAWLAEFCAEADNRLMIPVDSFLEYDASTLDDHYMDVCHFAIAQGVRSRLRDEINAFLDENAAFFAPRLSNVSEYVYPTF